MIIRGILNDPVAIIADFDWFNDYKDTRAFILDNAPPWQRGQLLNDFDAGYRRWDEETNNPCPPGHVRVRAMGMPDRFVRVAPDPGPPTHEELVCRMAETGRNPELDRQPLTDSDFETIGRAIVNIIARGHTLEIVPFPVHASGERDYSVKVPRVVFLERATLEDLPDLLVEALRKTL
jgi:hypothetical protein